MCLKPKAHHECSPFIKPDLVRTWDAGTPWVSTEQYSFQLGIRSHKDLDFHGAHPGSPFQGTIYWLLQVSLHRNKMTRAQHGGQGCHTKELPKEWSKRQPGSPTQAQPTDTCQCLACFSQFGHGPALEPGTEACWADACGPHPAL